MWEMVWLDRYYQRRMLGGAHTHDGGVLVTVD